MTTSPTPARQLTTAQKRVIAAYARGWPTGRVASELAISPKTVRGHVRRATERAGITSTRPLAALVNHAYANGDLADIPELAVIDHATPPTMRLHRTLHHILNGMAHGLPMTAIASDLGVQKYTADTYRRNLLARLGTNRAEHAVALGWQRRLLPYTPPSAGPSSTAEPRQTEAVR